MEPDLVSLMRKLAPDLADEIARRALILERISALQPVGRRQLAAKLHLPEREIRNTAMLLKDLGYVELNASGMTVSPKAEDILESARSFSSVMSGLTDEENRLAELLGTERVLIAPGDSDEDPQVLQDVGRICANRVKAMLQNGNTLAVTGGRTIAAVARSLQSVTPLNVMVVPARGGLGHSVELQANTLAEEIAGRLGGHYRLIHLPDRLDAAAMTEMLKLPEVSEAMERLERADIILHGIGRAEDTMRDRKLNRATQNQLVSQNARGESFGSYYDLTGRCLMTVTSLGVDPARLKPDCRMIAAAAGSSKAEAIISVLRSRSHALLVTDQGAADRMLRILQG